jgi:hypothetical protein
VTHDDGKPIRYTIPMKREFSDAHPRAQVIGSPIRQTLGGDVMITGIVVDWIDHDDYIDLVVELQES